VAGSEAATPTGEGTTRQRTGESAATERAARERAVTEGTTAERTGPRRTTAGEVWKAAGKAAAKRRKAATGRAG